MRKDAMQSSENIDQVLLDGVPVVTLVEHGETAGEDLGVRHDICSPVQRVAAVVDGATTLGLVVYGAQELPLGGAHLGASRLGARRGIEEEADYQIVALHNQEATELVEPQCLVNARRRRRDLRGSLARDGLRARIGMMVMQSSEMLLELESRVELLSGGSARVAKLGCKRRLHDGPH